MLLMKFTSSKLEILQVKFLLLNEIYDLFDLDNILFFDCGIHAREWIAPATCLYVIEGVNVYSD